MAKFQADPSSESSSVNGDASPRTPPTPCLQGRVNGSYCTSTLCTRCVEMRNLPDSNSNDTSGPFGQPKSDRTDSKSDAPAARSEASPCRKDIPIIQRKYRVCANCYDARCPNATITVGPPPCPMCRKPDCLGGVYDPGSIFNPHWKFKSDSVRERESLFTSGSPNSDGLPKGDNPDSKALNAKFEALEAKCDDLVARFDALSAKVDDLVVDRNSKFDHKDSEFDVVIRNMVELVERLRILKLSGV